MYIIVCVCVCCSNVDEGSEIHEMRQINVEPFVGIMSLPMKLSALLLFFVRDLFLHCRNIIHLLVLVVIRNGYISGWLREAKFTIQPNLKRGIIHPSISIWRLYFWWFLIWGKMQFWHLDIVNCCEKTKTTTEKKGGSKLDWWIVMNELESELDAIEST